VIPDENIHARVSLTTKERPESHNFVPMLQPLTVDTLLY
jgi:hypothetical protein